MPLNDQGIDTGWISEWAFMVGALAATARGRQAMADAFVNAAKLDADAVETAKIKDLAVATGKLAALAVTEAKLAAAAVTETKLATGAVTAVKTAGVTVPNVLGAPSVEAAGVDDVLAAVDLPAAATAEVLLAVALPAAATNEVHAAIALADGQTTEVVTDITNPPTPRFVAIKGNAAGIVGNVVIVGTDGADQAANDTIVAAGTAIVQGDQVFKTITSITVPARNAEGNTIAVGLGVEITYGLTNPDVPRTLAILGSQAGVTGNVTIEGTDNADAPATEIIAAVDDTKVYGTQIFKTVTSVTLPPLVGAGDTIAVGIGRDITVGITAPDVPRTVAVKGNQIGVAGDVVVTGTNYSDAAITETIVAADADTVYGTKAFKTVTSIRVPALVGAGDTVAVGRGKALGLHQVLAAAGQVVFCLLDRAIQAPTVAVDADEIEKNTVDLSAGVYNGAKVAVAMIYR